MMRIHAGAAVAILLITPSISAAGVRIVVTDEYTRGASVSQRVDFAPTQDVVPVYLPDDGTGADTSVRWGRYEIRFIDRLPSTRTSALAATAGVRGYADAIRSGDLAAAQTGARRLARASSSMRWLPHLLAALPDTPGAPTLAQRAARAAADSAMAQGGSLAALNRASLLEMAEMRVLAARTLESAAASGETVPPDMWRRVAELHLSDQNVPAAIEALDRQTGSSPEDARSWTLLAAVHLAEGDPAKCFAAAETAVRLAPADPEARLLAGCAAARLGQVERAGTELREALRLAEAQPLPESDVAAYRERLASFERERTRQGGSL